MDEYGPGELKLANGTIIRDSIIHGSTMLVGCQDVTFENCEFVGSPTGDKAVMCFLGGRGFKVLDSLFRDGVQRGQLSIGLNSRVTGAARNPYDWLIQGCEFQPPEGQWGNYPQTHHIYCLADPNYSQNGRIVDCDFSGHPFGYNVKIGGTGKDPIGEGAKGITLENCRLHGVMAGGRAATILLEGASTDAAVIGCTVDGDAVPYIQAVDGARLRMSGTVLPKGVVEYSSWKVLYFFSQSAKKTVPVGVKPANIGGISWV